MEIVIDIPKKDYIYIAKKHCLPSCDERTLRETCYEMIAKGVPLPKGHGRIMDVDKVIKKMEEREEQLKDDRSIWETAGVETALDMFGEIIIEADRSEE